MKELKATELKIGNYVHLYLNDEDKKEVCIDLADLNYIYNYEGDYSGIPLTEDWLLRLGFERNNNAMEITHGIKDTYTNAGHGIFSIWNPNYDLDKFSLNTTQWSTEIKSVHQLQNLYFALTNTELTIKKGE